ncbi:uncharacterized protein LOC127103967 [Lathyrus oleraceus]|uniref:uncharacterized protein LOC127103967 n=1 Tax=Pisum sativum TaxID=3888 RepID=UPI0021D0150F|nr:uncharacterized protein LOC127103967 [Pisum sativum]
MYLEKHEKSQKEKKEKAKDIENKFIALKASSYKSSTNDTCESESSDDDKDMNEYMGLFVRRYNRYLRKNEVQHSDKNLVNYRGQSKFSNQEESKTTKSRGSCYNCENSGHYKPDCPLLKKDKVKNKRHKKSSKARRAYIAWESDSEPSSNGNLSDEEEKACLVTQGYNQEEGIEYKETYALISRLEAIRLLPAYACS